MPMEWSCGACSTPNPTTNRFCHECGAPRSAIPATATTASPEPVLAVAATRAADGERRYVTVMFCDMVGSTTMSGVLDPEELQAIMLAYQQACADAIERNGGYIAHYMGDGILAYFGYPIADEQAAVRAVRAGLALVHAVAQRQADVPALSVRVGVHSGITVVADMGAGQQRQLRDVVGETPNIAARIQSIEAHDALGRCHVGATETITSSTATPSDVRRLESHHRTPLQRGRRGSGRRPESARR